MSTFTVLLLPPTTEGLLEASKVYNSSLADGSRMVRLYHESQVMGDIGRESMGCEAWKFKI
jgi:hypothetical protein